MHMRKMAGMAVTAILLAAGGAASAEDRVWNNPNGGFFSDVNNWWNHMAPGPTDTAGFGGSLVGGASHSVGFNSNAETSQFDVEATNRIVIFDLGGHTYAVTDWAPYSVDITRGTVQVINGTLSVPIGGVTLQGNCKLFVGNGGSLECANIGQWYGGNSGELIVEQNGLVHVTDRVTLDPGLVTRVRTGGVLNIDNTFDLKPSGNPGALIMEGGTVTVGYLLAPDGAVLEKGGVISGFGRIKGRVALGASSTISANGGHLEVGDAALLDGFRTGGQIDVGMAMLTLNSLAFAELGKLTTLEGGTLRASNGVYLKGGNNISGWGQINTSIAAATGSSIYATGTLRLGDSNAFDGIDLDGRLFVRSNTVTLDDRNQAVLGALTTIEGGVLAAPNGLLVNFGRNLVGRGLVETPNDPTKPLTNNGTIAGDSMSEPLVLKGYIKGVGTMENVVFEGTYAPGLSAARVYVGNAGFSQLSRLVMELGGTGAGEYDQLFTSGVLNLGGTLHVELLGVFVPQYGSAFKLFNGNLAGTFEEVELPALPMGLAWSTDVLHTGGTLSVVPESATLSLLALGGLAMLRRKK